MPEGIGTQPREIDNQGFLEKEKTRQNVGVVSLFYHPPTDSMLVIEEKKSKDATCKQAGELSFPAETRKVGENRHENLLGSLAEAFNDTHSRQFGKHLHLGYYYHNAFDLENNPKIPVDVALFIYDGNLFLPTPVVTDEVGAFGWVPMTQLDKLPLRSVARQALTFVMENDKLNQVARTHTMNTGIRRQLRQRYFSLATFHELREQKEDVPIR